MDSLTQIVLGAAVGEIALGRKIGNRALIWGAIGGTIPDLDVLANPFMDDIESLAFHRGITHSILFSVVAPLIFGGLLYKLYESKFHKSKIYKAFITIQNIGILGGITYGINYLLSHDGYPLWWFLIISILGALFLLMRLYHHYMVKELEEPKASFKEWYWLFFLAFATHWLLDCCTAFGTQIFQPFSDYRVAFNNIAVVDPLYTIPFLLCMIIVSTIKRNTRRRAIVNWIGIGISSLYMMLTVFNKLHVDRVFDKALAHRKLDAIRSRTSAATSAEIGHRSTSVCILGHLCMKTGKSLKWDWQAERTDNEEANRLLVCQERGAFSIAKALQAANLEIKV